jgi:hypothetical protein
MGISMALLAASDEHIREHLVAPKTVDMAFERIGSMLETDRCLLHDRWAVIHFLCTRDMEDGRPPLGLLKAGQLEVLGTKEPAYAIYADAVQIWNAALRSVPDEEFRRRLDDADLLTAGPEGRAIYPGRWYLAQGRADNSALFDELQWYVSKLRAFLAATAARRYGLILSRYEDL